MNKRIDFSYNGGFPATQYMTDYMQQSYRAAFIALAGLIGDKVIVMGCQRVGDQVTNGWLSVNGELVPFVGGAWEDDAQVVIVETSETRLFQDDTSRTVYFKREARIGTPGQFAFSALKQPSWVPQGLISMWSGTIAAIPAGWALCDGTNGTPNLKGKFIVGYDTGDADYNAIGATGGEKEHRLTIDEMPSHRHHISGSNQSNFGGGGYTPGVNMAGGESAGDTDDAGGDEAHENRPPYYTLAYIIKL